MTIVRTRRWLSLGLLLLLAFVLPAFGQARNDDAPQQQAGPNRAGLVIRHGDGRIVTACVSFDEPSISGLDLLQRAGVPILVQQGGIGTAVCKIDNEGCDYPAEDCFCKRDGPKTIYWAYNRLTANGWMLSPLGASATKVQPGDVEGWAWGSGSVSNGAQPPLVSFDEACPAQASAPVPPTSVPPTATPTFTPVPPTATPQPKATPPPTETAQPSATPQPQSAPAAPTNTPRPTSASATPTASTVLPTPSATPVPPTALPQLTDTPVAPTVLPTSVPELAQAATSAPPLPSATPVPPTAPASPIPVQTAQPTLATLTQTPQPTLAASMVASVPTSAPALQATPEGAGVAISQSAPPNTTRSNYVVFAVLACALISAILAIYAQRMR